MKALTAPPTLTDQVHQAILSDIAAGKLKPGERIIQEQIADVLRVSRQPVQQALLLLRNQGVLREAPGRGLIVAPLDLDYVQNMYDIRAVIEGLKFRDASVRETATRLGMSEGAVKITAHRGYKTLRRLLGGGDRED